MIHFSVVTVVKNDLVGLKKSRESLEAQLHKNWTHIIIDGKSDAATLKYLRKLPTKNTIWVSELDSGIYSAMNKGWKLADPESFVFYLNARDVFADENALLVAAKTLFRHPRKNWGCTTHVEISKDGNTSSCKLVSKPNIRNQLYAFGYRSHQGVVMRQSFIARLGGFDETFRHASDWDLIVRAMLVQSPITWMSPIAVFELGGNSAKYILASHKELLKLRKRYFLTTFPERFYDYVWRAIYLKSFGYLNAISPLLEAWRVLNLIHRDFRHKISKIETFAQNGITFNLGVIKIKVMFYEIKKRQKKTAVQKNIFWWESSWKRSIVGILHSRLKIKQLGRP